MMEIVDNPQITEPLLRRILIEFSLRLLDNKNERTLTGSTLAVEIHNYIEDLKLPRSEKTFGVSVV